MFTLYSGELGRVAWTTDGALTEAELGELKRRVCEACMEAEARIAAHRKDPAGFKIATIPAPPPLLPDPSCTDPHCDECA
jgi:hypothetical protein